jgi:thiol-disulfide isomerase/thioredoxin
MLAMVTASTLCRYSPLSLAILFRCGHCKKMAPVLDKVAPLLEGKMAIGKIDCTVHKKVCSTYKVRGYPTLMFALDGDVQDYPGGRDEAAITAFADKMSAPAITVVNTYDEALEAAASKTEEGVAFLGYDPKSTAESPTPLHQIFSQVARRRQAAAHFLWLENPEERDYAFVHRIETGVRPKGYDMEKEMTTESLIQWVGEENIALVATLGPSNFHRIGNNGRPLVISVVDMENEEQSTAIKAHMMEYVTTVPPEQADQYYYGMIDGKKWARFLEQFNVVPEECPQTLVLDVPQKKFWQNSTYTNLFDFMAAVNDGSIPSDYASKSGQKGYLAKLENMFLGYFPYSLILLLFLVFGFVFMLVPSGEDLKPPYDRIPPENGDDENDDDEPQEEEKEDTDEPKKDK